MLSLLLMLVDLEGKGCYSQGASLLVTVPADGLG